MGAVERPNVVDRLFAPSNYHEPVGIVHKEERGDEHPTPQPVSISYGVKRRSTVSEEERKRILEGKPDAIFFSDFSEEVNVSGKKLSITDIMNKLILVTGYKFSENSKYNDAGYLSIQYEMDGQQYVTFTSSKVLYNQLEKYQKKLPFYATICKVNNYYTFS